MKLLKLMKKFLCLGCTSLLVVGNTLAVEGDASSSSDQEVYHEKPVYILDDNNLTDFSVLSNRSFHIRDKYMTHIIGLFYKCCNFAKQIDSVNPPEELSPKLNQKIFRTTLILEEIRQYIFNYCDYMDTTFLDARKGYTVEENDECINILYNVFFNFERVYNRISEIMALTRPYKQYDNIRATWKEFKKELKYRTMNFILFTKVQNNCTYDGSIPLR